ncbi:MAG: thiolase domain-containing protein, partial [Myxococcales bacterium]|nr:thiolase domain-containing protein [Myxococcales bacterium]
VGKPIFRVHTAGSVGGSTAVVASHLIQTGVHEQVLTLAFEKQSEANAMWALSPAIPFQPQLVAGAGGYFAPLIRSYMARHDAHPDAGPMVAVKDRENGMLNPNAHLHLKQTLDEVKAAPMLWDPIRYSETCPSSDGAVAMVLANDKHAKGCKNPAWVLGTSVRTERTFMAGRDQVNPGAGQLCAKDVYDQAGIDPRKDVDCAEIYVPFSWFEPMWLENLGFCEPGEGWKWTMEGKTRIGGQLPLNMSGGVLCTNPIGASGMIRFAEAARQVRGTAAAHQVDGAKIAVGHAYGGGSQFFAMWAVGSARP